MFGQALAQSPTMGLFLNDISGQGGYTLFRQMQDSDVYLIDEFGRKVHKWETSSNTWFGTPYLLDNGNLMLMDSPPFGLHLVELDWGGRVVWDWTMADSTSKQHHDIEVLPDGNVLICVRDFRQMSDIVQAGRDTTGMVDTVLWSEKLIEVKKTGPNTGTVVWEWSVWDHLVQDFNPLKDNYGTVPNHPELIDINFGLLTTADWLHMNSVDYNADLDQIVLSTRSLSEFWIIDHSTTTTEAAGHTGGDRGHGGDILYRWGNPQAYGAGDGSTQVLGLQHDANWIRPGYPGEGHILVFNNYASIKTMYSSVLEVATPIDPNGNYSKPAPGTPYGPVAPFWEWTDTPPESTFANFISGCRRLSNGNTLINNGPSGEFLEVEPSGELVWHYVTPVRSTGPLVQGSVPAGNQVFRAYRFEPNYPAFAGRDLTPTSAIALNPVTVIGAGPDPTEPSGDADIAITANVMADVGLNTIHVNVNAGTGYTNYLMHDDGLNGDGLAGDGKFGALIGRYDDLTMIEYYFEAVDDTAAVVYDPPNPPSSVYRFTVGISCGNIDGVLAGGSPIDISDLTYFVDYLFNGGPEPIDLDAANVDGVTTGGSPIDISDLTYLVDYLFGGGPSPACT